MMPRGAYKPGYIGWYMPVYTTRVCTHPVPPWVYPTLYSTGYTAAPRPACGEAGPWAQEERMSWVGELLGSRESRSVSLSMPFCAELIRLSGREWIKIG